MESQSLARLSALGHPQRLAVFRLLMRRYPDALPAGEIAQVLGMKASTLSACLSTLRQAGLILQDRHGTSLHCSADVAGAGDLVSFLFGDCCRGRPEICPPLAMPPLTEPAAEKHNVLFICTRNSARSILAEAILRDMGSDRFNAFSAGSKPATAPHPMTLDLLRDKGHDTAALRAKTVAEFQGADAPRLDFVFTVCDLAANEDCPAWHGRPVTAHWGVPDPVGAPGSEAERRLAFARTYELLRHRIHALTALPVGTLATPALQAAVDRIARTREFS